MSDRYFVDGNVIRILPEESSPKLRKDGSPKLVKSNKQKGRKSEVYALDVADIKKITTYFADNGKWIHYLAFVLSCNLARRASDTLRLRWEHFFDPKTGDFRRDMDDFEEMKTDKMANPHINSAVRGAINKYIEMTGCDPAENEYKNDVFIQLSGNYKGKPLCYGAYMKALKQAGEAVGVAYNIGTHSPRKTFGAISRMLHPNDYDSMELLQSVFNHSSTKITKHYIGLTKQKVDEYYDDMGNFFDKYITGSDEFVAEAAAPIVTIEASDLRDVIAAAYNAGRMNEGAKDPMSHLEAINEIMKMVDGLRKA